MIGVPRETSHGFDLRQVLRADVDDAAAALHQCLNGETPLVLWALRVATGADIKWG